MPDGNNECRCVHCGSTLKGPGKCDACGDKDPLRIELHFELLKAEYDFIKSLCDLGLLKSEWVSNVERVCGP